MSTTTKRVVNVTVKWAKQKYNVELDLEQPPLMFKAQLYALTGVPTERQKIMGLPKGGILKDDTDWSRYDIKNGHTLMLVGSADTTPVDVSAAASSSSTTTGGDVAMMNETPTTTTPPTNGQHPRGERCE